MTTEVVGLALAVDSTQVVSAERALDRMASAGKTAETAATAVEAASRRTAAASAQAAVAHGNAAAALGKLAAVAGSAGSGGMKSLGAQAGAAASGMKLTAFQATQLSNQLQDLFIQIQGGANPLTAIAQQGSQLSAIFGGAGNALKAVSSIFSVFRVAVGGAAAALAGLALLMKSGSDEAHALERSIQLTGNAAGVSRDRIESLARQTADLADSSVAAARETASALLASGRFTAETLTTATQTAVLFARATGQSTSDVAASFVSMADNVGGAAEKLNRTYHFLTAEQLRLVKAAEDSGDRHRAMQIVMESLSRHVARASGEVGILTKAWNSARDALSDYIDKWRAIGRPDTLGETVVREQGKLEELQARAARLQQLGRDPGRVANLQRQAAEQQALVDRLKESVELGRQVDNSSQRQAQQEEAKTAFLKLQNDNLSKQEKLRRDLDRAAAIAERAGAPKAARDALLKAIRENAAGSGGGASKAGRAELTSDVSAIGDVLEKLTSAYSGAEQQLEAARSAGLTSERAYYDAKRVLLQLDAKAQVEALESENTRLLATKKTGAEKLELERRVADNRTKLAAVEIATRSKLAVLDTQQDAGLRRVASAYDEAKTAAESYIATLRQQSDRDLARLGIGDAARSRLQAFDGVEDRARQQRDAISRERDAARSRRGGSLTADEESEFDRRLALVSEYSKKELDLVEQNLDARAVLERDFSAGVRESLANYVSESANSAKQAEEVFTRAFRGMEDALTQFLTTGKLDFKGFAASIISDLLRIEIRARLAAAAASFQSGGGLGSVLSAFVNLAAGSNGAGTISGGSGLQPGTGSQGFSLGPGRADGGPVKRGVIYPVNERRGPGELLNVGGRQYLMAGADGFVSKAGGGAYNPTITVNVDSRTDSAEVHASVLKAIEQSQERFARDLHNMGVI